MLKLVCSVTAFMLAFAASAQERAIRFAPSGEDAVLQAGASYFAEAAEESGLFTVELVEPEGNTLEGLQAGSYDMATIPIEQVVTLEPAFYVFLVPLFQDFPAKIEDFLWTEEAQNLFGQLDSHGVKGLTYWPTEPRAIFSNRPIDDAEGLEGLKLRVPAGSVDTPILAALGVTPAPIMFSEVYAALQAGTVDGAESTPTFAKLARWNDVTPYASLLGYVFRGDVVAANSRIWTDLSGEERTTIVAALSAATSLVFDEARSSLEIAEGGLAESGFEVVNPSEEVRSETLKAALQAFPDLGVRDELLDLVVAGAEGGGDPCVIGECRCINRTCSAKCCSTK